MVKKMTLSCDTCIWNDDGLCDRLGVFVDPDDKCKFGLWERVQSGTEEDDS